MSLLPTVPFFLSLLPFLSSFPPPAPLSLYPFLLLVPSKLSPFPISSSSPFFFPPLFCHFFPTFLRCSPPCRSMVHYFGGRRERLVAHGGIIFIADLCQLLYCTENVLCLVRHTQWYYLLSLASQHENNNFTSTKP